MNFVEFLRKPFLQNTFGRLLLHLQTFVKQIPLYIKDTSNFISRLKAVETVPDISYLVLPDVKSYYTNIPNPEEIKAVKTLLIKAVKISLDNFPGKEITAKVITFLSLILTLSNFVFDCKNYI